MALKKRMTMKNGLTLEYHRVASMTIDPNHLITILRYSYLNEEARQYEKDYAQGLIKDEPEFPYIYHEYVYINYAEYIEEMNGELMPCAYRLLKKYQPELADAEDI